MKLRHEPHSNATWIKIRFNSIQFQFKTNEMQIGGKGIQNCLMNTVLEKKTYKKTQIEKDTFPCLFTW
jgi:hypothetical protein